MNNPFLHATVMKRFDFDRAVDGSDAGVYKHKLRDESYVLRVL